MGEAITADRKSPLYQHVVSLTIGVLMGLLVIPGLSGLFAQGVGIGTTTPHPSAYLHIAATNKGILLPRVGISALTSPAPISVPPAIGLLVFNDGSGGVTPRGFYWWDGVKWRYLMDSISTMGIIIGDGSTTHPIRLQPGSNIGDLLVWNGTQWTIGSAPYESVCSSAMNNYVQKWTGTKLCNSLIYDDGTNIGIGTSSPAATLDVNGTVRIRTLNTVAATTTNDKLLIANNNGDVLAIAFTGNNSDYLRGDGTWGAISGGDNWGTQVAITSSPITGDGTSANPIRLQSATNTGDIIVWYGSQWSIQQPSPSNGIAAICGSPTANYIQKWTGTNMCNSLIYDNGTNVAIGTTSPNSDALLELNAPNKGFLPPRVALSAANLASPLSAPAAGMLVYNTATGGTGQNAVVPGYYYWDGSRWQRLQNSGYAGAVLGNKASTNYILDAINPNAECTGATITLPPGKWIVNLTKIIRISQDGAQGNAPCYVWVRTTLADGTCTQGTQTSSLTAMMSSDLIVGSLISGAIGQNWAFGIVNGSLIVNNTSGTNKTYSVWGSIQLETGCTLGSNASSSDDGLTSFLGPAWGETQFYALPVN